MQPERRHPKPPVADLNQQAAIQNINRKIDCLQSWIQSGIPYVCDEAGALVLSDVGRRQLDYFPATLRQFNFWDGSQNCAGTRTHLGGLRRNANDTLRRHQSLRKSVEILLSEIVKAADAQERQNRPEIVAKIKRQWAVEHSRTVRLEVELIEHRKQLKVLEAENKRLNQLNKEISKKSHEAISSLEEEVTRLNGEISLLNKKLLKLVPLTKVR